MEENKDWRDILPERIQEAIERKKDEDFKYNQKTLCQNIGISEATLSLVMQGKRNPRIDTIIAISDELNVDVDFLIGKTNHERRPKSKEGIKIEELCDMFGMNKDSINTLLTTFYNGKDDDDIEKQATLDAVYGKEYWYHQLMWKLERYFEYNDTHPANGAYVMLSSEVTDMSQCFDDEDDDDKMRIEVTGEVDDFYDNFDGKGYLTTEQYEDLLLNDIIRTIKNMKKYSAFGLTHLQMKIEYLKNIIENDEEAEKEKDKNEYDSPEVIKLKEELREKRKKDLEKNRAELKHCERLKEDIINYNKNKNWPTY